MSRLIKKYSNRRLYDKQARSCVTMDDIKRYVLSFEDFVVIDAKTGEDITRVILLRIFLGEENCSSPIFSDHVLKVMIRCYSRETQDVFSSLLDKGIREFVLSYQNSCEENEGQGSCAEKRFSDLLSCFSSPWGSSPLQGMVDDYLKNAQTLFDRVKEQAENMQFSSTLQEESKDH